MARVDLVQGNLTQAEERVAYILAYVEAHSLQGVREPLRIYQTYYQILQATHSPQAGDVLAEAYDLLQSRAAQITDPARRRTFLEQIAVHHDIIKV